MATIKVNSVPGIISRIDIIEIPDGIPLNIIRISTRIGVKKNSCEVNIAGCFGPCSAAKSGTSTYVIVGNGETAALISPNKYNMRISRYRGGKVLGIIKTVSAYRPASIITVVWMRIL